MRILIIIPTYNEIENLEPIVNAVLAQTPDTVSLLIADDNSPDGTGLKADELKTSRERLSVLHRQRKEGLGPAYVAGFRYAIQHGYDAVIQMDADFSHNPKFLSRMISLLSVKDFVIGSRNVEGGGTVNWSLLRRFISWGGSVYARIVLGVPIRDFTGGFNGWRRAVLEAVGLDTLESGGYAFQIEMKYRAFRKGFKHVEFPIVFEDRRVGHSKMSFKIVLEALIRLPRLRLKNVA
jgi:dolichol-phosphate mannosyltransferase